MFARIATDWDLWAAVAFQVAASLTVFELVRCTTRCWRPAAMNGLALATLGLLFVYIGTTWDRVWLTWVLPLSNLVILGNAFPLLTAGLAALVWHRSATSGSRRFAILVSLAATGLIAGLWPILGRAPQCGDRWLADGTCLQTTHFTCSAACAATLLQAHGIRTTEQEMADLCLTRHGTTWMGLYRGLKKKTDGTAWDVVVEECTLDDLRRIDGIPAILRVGLERSSQFDERFALDMGWHPGLRHSVVWRGFVSDDCVEISDPTPQIGREIWTADELRQLWQGQVVRLVPRR